MYVCKFSPRGCSEPVYKYIQGQTVKGLRKSATVAHILRCTWQLIRSALSGRNRNRPQHRDHYPTLYKKCVGSFKSLNRRIERLDLRFNVLIQEDAKILEQRQHLLLNYFKTLSVGPAGKTFYSEVGIFFGYKMCQTFPLSLNYMSG